MHNLANEIISKNVKEIIDSWDFDLRKKTNPNGCLCYQEDKKCHDIENLNCFFCYCPNYDRTINEGGCKINNPKGKYIDGKDGKIWDCSNCDFPHVKDNAIKLLEGLFR